MSKETIARRHEADQSMKTVNNNLRMVMRYAKDWDILSPGERDALYCVALAMARITSGHHNKAGCWADIRDQALFGIKSNLYRPAKSASADEAKA